MARRTSWHLVPSSKSPKKASQGLENFYHSQKKIPITSLHMNYTNIQSVIKNQHHLKFQEFTMCVLDSVLGGFINIILFNPCNTSVR